MSDNGWTGVDLDGTLAYYDRWRGETHIGAPVPKMMSLVRALLAEGKDVRIFTARASHEGEELAAVTGAIDSWCLSHFGRTLPITCKKDYHMVDLYDDRCKQVVRNEGTLLEDVMQMKEAELHDLRDQLEYERNMQVV